MRRIAITAIVAVFALVLSACGDTGPLAKVKVSKDDAPTVTFSKDFSVEKTVSRVITEGDGEKLKKGDTISFVYLAMNGRTAKQFDNTFKTDQKTSITLTEETTLAGALYFPQAGAANGRLATLMHARSRRRNGLTYATDHGQYLLLVGREVCPDRIVGLLRVLGDDLGAIGRRVELVQDAPLLIGAAKPAAAIASLRQEWIHPVPGFAKLTRQLHARRDRLVLPSRQVAKRHTTRADNLVRPCHEVPLNRIDSFDDLVIDLAVARVTRDLADVHQAPVDSPDVGRAVGRVAADGLMDDNEAHVATFFMEPHLPFED